MTLIKEYLKSKFPNMKEWGDVWGEEIKYCVGFVIAVLLQIPLLVITLFSLGVPFDAALYLGIVFGFLLTLGEAVVLDDYKSFKSDYKPLHKIEGETT